MRLIMCRLCSGEDPFACPIKFRRTYMQLHLEKSHGVVAKELKISRVESRREGLVAEWVSVMDGLRTGILVELEVDVGSGAKPVSTNERAPVEGGPGDKRVNWSSDAMRELYRGIEGQHSPV